MNTEDKLKIIEEITLGYSVRLRENYFIKYHEDIHNQIIEYTKDIKDITFIQKIWHWVNNYPNYYLCKCGNRTTFNRNWKLGYRKGCSAKCTQSDIITKERRKKTTLEKWGVDNISKLDSIKLKAEQTCVEKWGFKSTSKNPIVKNKYKKTINKKWGVDHYFQTEEFKLKYKNYYLQKFGVDHPLKLDEVKERIKKINLEKWGVETYLNTEHARGNIKSYNRSKYEDEISEWLSNLNILHEINNREIIKPLLLDIYIPEYKLAIEFNGLYWHSEFKKNKQYHLNKTLKCRESGVDLIHIWQDDWKNRKEVLKSIILNKLRLNNVKIFARKCRILEISDNLTVSKFLNENHIQGYTRFKRAFGLFYGEDLVSLMTFGKRWINSKGEWELIRFCNKINTSVVGSASKLFNFFIKNSDVHSIVSYSDISIFNGNLYKKIGFKYSGFSGVNYWWVVKGIRRHRFGWNKAKLIKMGYDPLKTEVEIMHGLGNFRIFGCGQERWEWIR